MEPTATKNGEDGQLPENVKKECPVEASRETGQADRPSASTEPAPPNTTIAIDTAGDAAASVVATPKLDSVCSSNTSAPAEKQAEPSSDTEPSSRKRQAEDRDELQKSDIDSIASKKTKVSESYDPESALEDEAAATQTSAPVELGEHSMKKVSIFSTSLKQLLYLWHIILCVLDYSYVPVHPLAQHGRPFCVT